VPNLSGKLDRLLAAAKDLLRRPSDDPRQQARDQYLATMAAALERLEPLGLSDELHDKVTDLFIENGKWVLYGLPACPVTSLIPWPLALADLLVVTPADLRERVVETADPHRRPNGALHPVAEWVHNLNFGRCRLPDGLTEATVRQLLAVCLDRTAEVNDLSCCCDGCGLQRPHRKWRARFDGTDGKPPADFFAACTHCGQTDWTWTHLTNTRA
jgi:hypothetical protein